MRDFLAFDPARLESLRKAMAAALDDLRCLRSDDAPDEVMWGIRSACQSLDEWLPRVHDVLQSKSMSSTTGTKFHDYDNPRAIPTLAGGDPLWQIIVDPRPVDMATPKPPPMYGPPLPGNRSFGEVLQAIGTGELRPMTPPLDANGRAGAHYTSFAFHTGLQREVGHADMTSGLLKFLDFWSDGLPVSWREHKELRIIYFKDVVITSSVHVLSAYDRDEGPETEIDLTTEATVSGYLVVKEDSIVSELSKQIGPGEQDPTMSFPFISESTSTYSGVFYPDHPPDFHPVGDQPRIVGPSEWTFTTSAAPMVDGWGTWGY